MFILIRLTQHIVYQLSQSAHSSCHNSARLQPTQPGIIHMLLFT